MPIIDSGIYNALMQPQKSAFDYAEQYASADDRKTQRAMNALQMQQLQQGIADDNALRAYMKQSPNLADAGVQATLYGIAPKAAGGILKDRALMDKELAQTAQAKSATAGSDFDLQRKKLDFAWQAIGAAPTPQHAQQIISDGVQRGYFTPEQGQAELQSIPQDPQGYSQWRQQKMLSILSVKDQMDQQWKAVEAQRLQAGQDETIRHNRATEGLTARGQNMTDARARDANNIAAQGNAIKGETDLRKEFNDLPEVKNFKQAAPAFRAIQDAATRNTPAADINLVYGIAKIYDPNSVVREGEYATVANSPNIPDRIKGYAQYLANGGRLTPEVKKQLVAEAQGRYDSFKAEYDNARGTYEGVARKRGMDAGQVFTEIGVKPQAPSGAPAIGAVKGGYRFKGGNPADQSSWEKV